MAEKTLCESAASDEMLLRCLCDAYTVADSRGMNMNSPEDLAVLLSGAVRFTSALAYAQGFTTKGLSEALEDAMKTHPKVTEFGDAAVRRWLYLFRDSFVDSDVTAQILPSIDPPTYQ